MRKIVFYLICLFTLNVNASSFLKVVYIADHQVDCGEKKCFLTRDSPTDSFLVFNNTIEGFSFEVGYEYCILMEVRTSDNSSTLVKYILSELKSKTKTNISKITESEKIPASIPDTSKWMLYKLRMKDGSTRTFSLQKAYLQFDIKNNTVSGNTECNSLSAGFSIDSTAMKFDNIVTTKMACGKHSIEPLFLNMLNSVTNFKVTSKLFYLLKGKTLLGLFTRKK